MIIEHADCLPDRVRKSGFYKLDVYEQLSYIRDTNEPYTKLTVENDEYYTSRDLHSVVYNAVKNYKEFSSVFEVRLINGETWLIRTDI